MSGTVSELLTQANAALAAGRLTDAERLALAALEADPECVQANLLMGVLAGRTGRDEIANQHLGLVLERQTDSFEALFWMSILAKRAGRTRDSISFAEMAVALRPQDGFALNNLGLCLLEENRAVEAADKFRQAAAARPEFAQVFHNLGTALYFAGNNIEAEQAFRQAISLDPKQRDSHLNIGQIFLAESRPGAARQAAAAALNLDPHSAPGHLLMASALAEAGDSNGSSEYLDRALQLDPSDAQAHGLLAQRLQSLGPFAEANEHLQRSIALKPDQGFAYFAYVFNNTVGEKDRPMVAKMAELASRPESLPRELNFLQYGLGRAYEKLGEFAPAMKAFDDANALAKRLKLRNRPFDRTEYARSVNRTIAGFPRERLARQMGTVLSARPVFIVGMMRSGTTLAEQIVSAHSEVCAAGELPFWPNEMARMPIDGADKSLQGKLNSLAERYVAALDSASGGARYTTDKMPVNFEFLGALHMALPNARFIHLTRHPYDTCVSIYTTPNRVPIGYAYDRSNIAFAYEQYWTLMRHWRESLLGDCLLELAYEDLVGDREGAAHKMLAFLGLDWEDAVLHHELNRRNVMTPSVWQVRQPIYTASIGRWKHYEPWLTDFQSLVPYLD